MTEEQPSAFNYWKRAWGNAFRQRAFANDAISGLTVAAVALPLNVALAVTCGLPAIAGVVGGIIGGALAAIFGGSRLQVTGPAAALSSMVITISAKYGPQGVAAATLIVGFVQLAMSFLQAGRYARFVPEIVLAGFTTGVGLKLLDQQLPELLGFDYRVQEMASMMHEPQWLHEVSLTSFAAGLAVMFFLVAMRPYKRFPAALFALILVTFVSQYEDSGLKTVGDLPSGLPSLMFPQIADNMWVDIILAAVPLGLLAGVESLLSASAIDRMTHAEGISKYHPNLELFGQGLANLGTSLFSGMPVSGVIVRSSLNVAAGGKTRMSALFHALWLFVALAFFTGYIRHVPLPALAGLLCVIGFRLVEAKHFFEAFKTAPLEALAFGLACVGTVTGHLMLGLILGIAVGLFAEWLHKRNVDTLTPLDDHSPNQRARIIRRGFAAPGAPVIAKAPVQRATLPSARKWVPNVRSTPLVPPTAFVHPHATVIGRVILGDNVHVSAEVSLRADEGAPFYIGNNTNVQDGVILHALQDKYVWVDGAQWAIFVGNNVSMAHQALVHGPSYVGDDCFIGFKAVVHNAVLGAGCFVGIGAVVVGVDVPEKRYVPHGSIIDTQEKADDLPPVTHDHQHFNEDVVEVNRGLAAAYRANLVVNPPSARRAAAVRLRPGAWDTGGDDTLKF